MAMPLNIFEENWVKKMNELLEKAKNSHASYNEFIDLLERRFDADPSDKHSRVRIYVAKLRKILWPENQFEREPSLLEVISKETFRDLKQEPNYKKFVEYYSKLAESFTPPTKS